MRVRLWVVAGIFVTGVGLGHTATKVLSTQPRHQPTVQDALRMVNQPAPDFMLPSPNKQIHLGAFKGKVVLLNFWESSCPYCRQVITQLVPLQRKFKPKGFEVIGVLLDEDDAKVVKALSNALALNYPVAIGNEGVAKQYGGILATPTSFLIDRKGRVARVFLGSTSGESLESAVQELIL